MGIFRTMSITLAASFVLFPQIGMGQIICPAGKTVKGECVNPTLANTARETAIIFSQPKISQTAYPILPQADRQYRYPNSLIPDQLQSPTLVLVPHNDGPAQVLINGKIQLK